MYIDIHACMSTLMWVCIPVAPDPVKRYPISSLTVPYCELQCCCASKRLADDLCTVPGQCPRVL